jgi:putative heme-binding domain-containing protein
VESGIVDVEVDVTGAETVWLVVGDAGNGNACDWADWIAPRLAGGGRTWDLTATPWLAAEAAWGTTQVGRDCAGGELSAGGVATADGIGTHAASRIAFAVPAGAERFSAHAGPDETGVSQGCGTSVVFEVWATRPPAASEAAAWERGMLDPAVPARERREHAVALASDPQGALRLIRLAERGVLPAELVDVVAEAIHRNPDLGVRALASAAFPRPGAPDTPSIPELVAMLERGGDAARGRAVFQDRERAQCITCHAFTSGDATVGGDVGPDLTAIGAKYDAAALCDAILNPSAAIAHGYDTWLVETLDGRLYSGFLLADGPTVVLKDTQGERHVLDAEEIADRVPQKLSTMPEGVALGLAPDELCDLVAFLREPGRATGLLGVERGGAPATDGVRPALGEPIPLFDGTALDAWTCHLPDGTPCDAVWSVADGVLACAGQPIGYLRTQDRFTSFHLAVEWRFDPAQGAGNSGVLLRVNGADQVWPRSIEAQLHSTNAGDIWNIDAMSMQVAPERTSGRRTERGQPSSEKPLGEWNRYDVWLWGPRLELYVNGVLQNTADWCEETPGYVALQSEGAPIEFRTVVLTPIAE